MKNEVTQDDIFAMVQQSKKRVKAKARVKERRAYAGTVVKVITTAEIPRMPNKTTAAQMVVRGRIRKAARQAKMQAKDGMQARAIGTAGETVRANTKTGKVVVSPKYGKVRTNRMIGARQRGKARAVRKAAAKAALTELTKLRKIHFVRYIRKKVQREGRHKENLRMSKESTVKEEESTHTTDIKHSTFLESIREEDEAEETNARV